MAKLYSLTDFFLKLLLLAIVISVFVPFSPKMPAPGLDPSWALSLNQAIAQGLSFGKDILFTLGPYSAIYTKAYHPSTDFMTMSGSFYLAFSYWFCMILLLKRIKWHWPLLFAFILFTMVYVRDSLFFSYPLLVGLVCYKLISFDYQTGVKLSRHPAVYPWTPGIMKDSRTPRACRGMSGENQQFLNFCLILIFTPFGLLPLIKGSLLILCTVIVVFCASFLMLNKKTQSAFLCLSVPLLSLLLFWVCAGQSISNLLGYLNSTLALAAGFSEAMATEGFPEEIILYLINSALILCFIALQKQIPTVHRVFLLGLFFVFLFLSFKTGFTRHVGHAYIASSSILIAALLLPFIFNSKIVFVIILVSFNTWSYINHHYTNLSIRNNFKSTYTSAWYGLKNRLQDSDKYKQDFKLIMNFIRQKSLFPKLPGSTDIYSYNQTYLIASQNTWSPRPVFQSYSVFTASLAKKNRAHLLGKNKPDHIIFKMEPIDDRIPSLEDGLSWPFLLANYQPVRMLNDFLLLQKRDSPTPNPLELITCEKHFLGETVIPPAVNTLFVEIEIKPTLFGYLSTVLFKPTPLYINFELQNGLKKQYRLIANMAKSGFLLSPLIENTHEFASLFENSNRLGTKSVKTFQITLDQSKFWQWQQEFIVHYQQQKK